MTRRIERATALLRRSDERPTRNRHPGRSGCRFPDFPFVFSQTIPTRPTTSGVTMTGSSTQGIKTVLHPVSDLEKAKAVYTALLGLPPQHDAPYYVGYEAEGQHIGLVPGGGPQGMTSPVAYWHVPDIEAKLAEVTAAGATVKEPAHDVGGGRLVATVTDPDGNVLGLLQDP
jgi:predicted enzyme related to lactoylglutathione lyase